MTASSPASPPASRGPDLVAFVVVRPLVFVAICALLWGSLLALSFVWTALTEGFAAAARAAAPGPSPWGWINVALGVLAPTAWLFALATWLGREKDGRG